MEKHLKIKLNFVIKSLQKNQKHLYHNFDETI